MQLHQILRQEAVRAIGASSKKRLFQALGETLAEAHGLPETAVVAALREREALGPTGVGHGVALPHARLPQVGAVTGCFLRLDRGVEFGAVDRQPVDLVFALFAPEEPSAGSTGLGCGVEHLRALAAVSRLMRDGKVRAKLRANADPAVLHAILTELPAIQAA